MRIAGIIVALLFVAACGDSSTPSTPGDTNGTMPPSDCAAGETGSECTPCPEGTYCDGTSEPVECEDGTWDHDEDAATECQDWQSCEPGFAPESGSAVSDATCVACPEGTFGDGNGACTSWTTCQPGERIAEMGSATQDRVCETCAEGTFSEGENVTTCQAWQTCEPGTYVSQSPSASQNRGCAACAPGSFSTDEDAASCPPWTTCPAGTSVTSAGSSTQDQTCEACPEGTFTQFPDSATCTPLEACPAGTYQVSPGAADEAPECETCETGSFCAGDDVPPVNCPAGTWDHDQNPASTCVDWTTCEAGEYVKTPGSALVDQSCEACAEGTFSTQPNVEACLPAGACDAGSVEITPATETAPAVCEACEPGTYCAGAGASAVSCGNGTWDHDANPATPCRVWTACVAGQFVEVAGTDLSDQTCASCPADTFSDTSNATQCLGWTVCAAGTRETAAPSATSDRVCTACAAGTYCPGGSSSSQGCENDTWDHDQDAATACESWSTCEPSQYVATAGSATTDRQCDVCPEGTYSDQNNVMSCTPFGACAPGTVEVTEATATTPAVCDPCPAGSYCPGGSAPEESCTADTWDHDANPATPCVNWTVCAAGQFVQDTGTSLSDRECTSCAAETYSEGQNAASCTAWTICAAGTHETSAASATQDRVCTACAAGTYCPGGTDPQVTCTAGTWDHDASASTACQPWQDCQAGSAAQDGTSTTNRTCTTCQAGTYASQMNASTCLPCSAGEYCPEGATAREACPAGTFDDDLNATTVCASCGEGVYCAGGLNPPTACTGNQYDHDLDASTACEDCASGYRAAADHLSCENIDECAEEMDTCAQVCQDTSGSYTCACDTGYTLQADQQTCQANQYWVTLDTQGGTPTTNPTAVTYGQSYGSIFPGNIARVGYSFLGWFTQASGGQLITNVATVNIASNHTLYAQWEANTYTVTLDLADGFTPASTLHVNFDAPYTGLPTPTRVGYDFLSWETSDGTEVTETDLVSIAANHTLTAQWSDWNFKAQQVSGTWVGAGPVCAISSGNVYCWGDNNYGQLGTGDFISSHTTPRQVLGMNNVISISAGVFACAVKSDGTVWCWGLNTYGQLGDGTTSSSNVPVQVVGLNNVVEVGTGEFHTCALKGDGTVWCWGRNQYGQTGTGAPSLVPVQVPGVSGAIDLEAGVHHTCVVKNDGTVWCWGWNQYGQSSACTSCVSNISPVEVVGVTNAVKVTTGYTHSCALKNDGTVWCWGQATRTGNPSSSYPQAVLNLTDVADVSAWEITCAAKHDGSVWCWGPSNVNNFFDYGSVVTSYQVPTLMPHAPLIQRFSSTIPFHGIEFDETVRYGWWLP
ncbi:InlB B-repeat-containing protein [Microvenator marinus]|nr:InlB B-repeat-containing protein [Microvenator marinus]